MRIPDSLVRRRATFVKEEFKADPDISPYQMSERVRKVFGTGMRSDLVLELKREALLEKRMPTPIRSTYDTYANVFDEIKKTPPGTPFFLRLSKEDAESVEAGIEIMNEVEELNLKIDHKGEGYVVIVNAV